MQKFAQLLPAHAHHQSLSSRNINDAQAANHLDTARNARQHDRVVLITHHHSPPSPTRQPLFLSKRGSEKSKYVRKKYHKHILNLCKKTHLSKNLNFLSCVGQPFALSHNGQLSRHWLQAFPACPCTSRSNTIRAKLAALLGSASSCIIWFWWASLLPKMASSMALEKSPSRACSGELFSICFITKMFSPTLSRMV